MAVVTEDLTRAADQAATDFATAFYTALQDSRNSIDSYYASPQTLPDGTNALGIQWNGHAFASGAEIQKMFAEDMPSFLFYDVHAVDAQVLNPRFSTETKIAAAKNISLLVTVNGHVRLEDRKTGPLKDFSETFVLVPNISKHSTGAGRGAAARKRDWLIQFQNFRYVVHHHPELIQGQVAMDVE